MHLRYIAIENIVRKGEIACNNQFLLFSQCFLPYMALIYHFKCTLTHSHTMTPFDASGKQAFENSVGKGEIARNEQFLLFPQCFLPIWIAFCHFRQI